LTTSGHLDARILGCLDLEYEYVCSPQALSVVSPVTSHFYWLVCCIDCWKYLHQWAGCS